jgi:hypothetical protein
MNTFRFLIDHLLSFCVVLPVESAVATRLFPSKMMPGHSGNKELGIVLLITYSRIDSPGIQIISYSF